MKSNWTILRAALMLIALPFMATAAVSAGQWMQDTTPIELTVDTSAVASSEISVARVHTVSLNDSGAIEGRIAAINAAGSQGLADLTVSFSQNGQLIQETNTSTDGSFRIEGLPEGNYSFVATGENGYAAYGVRVVKSSEGFDNVMEAAAIAPGADVAKQIVDENALKQAAQPVNDDAEAVVGANRVNVVNGTLLGSINSLVGAPVEATRVHILKGDQQIATATTDVNGRFSIENFKAGFYSLVSTGPSGIAAVGFEAIEDAVAEIEIPVAFTPAALQDVGFANSLDVCTTCGGGCPTCGDITYDAAPALQEFSPVEFASESIGCGGACGATCGACGNFAGGGGRLFGGSGGGGRLFGGGGGRLFGGAGLGRFGRLALLGGTIGGIVAIAVDDDDPEDSSPSGT